MLARALTVLLLTGLLLTLLASASTARAQATTIAFRVSPTSSPALAQALEPVQAGLQRCVAEGQSRIPAMSGVAIFVLHRRGARLLPVARVGLDYSVLGDQRTEQCLRRALSVMATRERAHFGPRDWVSLTLTVTASTTVPTCSLGDDSSGGLCASLNARLRRMNRALRETRVHGTELGESCIFTNVTVWLDAEARVVGFGVSSSNTSGDSPYATEFIAERAAAARTARSWPRAPQSAVVAAKVTFSAGGCD